MFSDDSTCGPSCLTHHGRCRSSDRSRPPAPAAAATTATAVKVGATSFATKLFAALGGAMLGVASGIAGIPLGVRKVQSRVTQRCRRRSGSRVIRRLRPCDPTIWSELAIPSRCLHAHDLHPHAAGRRARSAQPLDTMSRITRRNAGSQPAFLLLRYTHRGMTRDATSLLGISWRRTRGMADRPRCLGRTACPCFRGVAPTM